MTLDPTTDLWDRVRAEWGVKVKNQRGLVLASPDATKPGITQEQLAERSGVDQSTISRLEKGKLRYLSDEKKLRIAQALGCSIDHLFPWPVVMQAAA